MLRPCALDNQRPVVKISRNLQIPEFHRGRIYKTIRELTELDINTQQMCLNLRLTSPARREPGERSGVSPP
ncbi:MAG TPA: hypothetical protein PLY87_22140, partial [Planctomycetaceae bacterium]|nr:hypothetical protein [Planctomycetaceae bacterium]